MRIFIAAALLVSLVGCSTSPVSADRAKPAPSERVTGYQNPVSGGGTIIVTRDTGFIGGGCFAGVYLNGKRVAKLDTGEKATFQVAPGEWIVGAGLEGAGLCAANPERLEVTATIGSGDQKKFRVYNPGDNSFRVAPTTF